MVVDMPVVADRLPLWDRIYDGFVDTGSPRSLSTSFRSRRWTMLAEWIGDLSTMRVLDLGGTIESWSVAPVQPRHLTIVNRDEPVSHLDSSVDFVHGDVCDLDPVLTRSTWDLVYSNSVIEHLGGHERRQAFADGVRGLGTRSWIQTPNRYFPIEPHFLFPGLQFLPVPARAAVIRRWPLNKWRPADARSAMESALDLELIGRAELAYYLPDSDIVAERVGGLTKSIVAVR